MNRKAVLDVVVNETALLAYETSDQIVASDTLYANGLDSLDAVELFVVLEDHFDVSLDYDQIDDDITVDRLTDLIMESKNG